MNVVACRDKDISSISLKEDVEWSIGIYLASVIKYRLLNFYHPESFRQKDFGLPSKRILWSDSKVDDMKNIVVNIDVIRWNPFWVYRERFKNDMRFTTTSNVCDISGYFSHITIIEWVMQTHKFDFIHNSVWSFPSRIYT